MQVFEEGTGPHLLVQSASLTFWFGSRRGRTNRPLERKPRRLKSSGRQTSGPKRPQRSFSSTTLYEFGGVPEGYTMFLQRHFYNHVLCRRQEAKRTKEGALTTRFSVEAFKAVAILGGGSCSLGKRSADFKRCVGHRRPPVKRGGRCYHRSEFDLGGATTTIWEMRRTREGNILPERVLVGKKCMPTGRRKGKSA